MHRVNFTLVLSWHGQEPNRRLMNPSPGTWRRMDASHYGQSVMFLSKNFGISREALVFENHILQGFQAQTHNIKYSLAPIQQSAPAHVLSWMEFKQLLKIKQVLEVIFQEGCLLTLDQVLPNLLLSLSQTSQKADWKVDKRKNISFLPFPPLNGMTFLLPS